MTGVIFDIQRFSIHDGPGIRTLVFMKGCPLRCIWCDNPESQKHDPEVMYFANNCISCGRCLKVCPARAITQSQVGIEIDREKCRVCGRCIDTCYFESIKIVGRLVTVEEVLDEVLKDILFYRNSGGGVTVGGGEPTMQPRFVQQLLKKCQEHFINTAIETCGYTKWKNLKKILEYTDQVLYDIKHMDPIQHKKLTKVSNELILENIKRVNREGIPIRIRIPIIPGYNDSEENIKQTAKFLIGLKNVREADILPYHPFGVPKYERLSKQYKLKNCQTPTKENLLRIKEIMESYGVKVFLYG